jgi:hypothetical protein
MDTAAPLDDLLEHGDGVVGVDPPRCHGRQRFPGVLVGDGQDLDWSSVGRSVDDEVERPDVVGTGGGHMTGACAFFCVRVVWLGGGGDAVSEVDS